MSVEVEVVFEKEPSPAELEMLSALARATISSVLKSEGRDERDCEVSVVFSNDAFIAELNKEYRDVEGPTDVLSFAFCEGEGGTGFGAIQGMPEMLGDVIISVETAKRQAQEAAKGQTQEAGKSLEDELRLLLVHGTLHLLGYDHDTPLREAVMWKRQGDLLRAPESMDQG